MSEGITLIRVFAGTASDGNAVCEELPARKINEDIYELLASPGLALNLAKGDVIHIGSPATPVTVLKRGGNFCVQVYSDHISQDDLAWLESVLDTALQGSVDGVNAGNLAISIPANNGFEKINLILDDSTRRTGSSWYFANIYKNLEDPEDETLLDWWIPDKE
ncbi:DUF4265 domain-containing protein [Burkholderia gladioli]|uniref:DUF4265 domain-containing protein n=1 Tax=Burkholderia gladioli TaxID=28095 RepID=UPI00163F790E|nr:DUF4265 domain-containing protein [Burkholderia gladioli]